MKKKISLTGIVTVVSLLLVCGYVAWLTEYVTDHPRYPFTLWPPRYTGPPTMTPPNGSVIFLTNELNTPQVYAPPVYMPSNLTGSSNLFKNHPVWASLH